MIFQVKDNNENKKMFFTDSSYTNSFEPVDNLKDNTNNVSKYNKNSLYTQIGDTYKVYYNMYDSKTPFYKSAIYKKGKSQRNNTTYDFQDTTNHKLEHDLINAVQVENIIYAIEPKNSAGRYDLSCDIWSWISVDHNYVLPPLNKIDTTIYDFDYIAHRLNSNLSIDANLAIKTNLNNIHYNMIYEINGNIYNDYESGNIAANTFKGKNQFDCTYDMSHNEQYILKNTREYVDIDKCCNQVYLKYYDNINYANSSSNPTESATNNYGFKYQNIEIIKSINRYKNLNGHKSNLYSVSINTDILDNIRTNSVLTYDQTNALINNVILELKNYVKTIVETMQPAHTQLFNIYINGN